MPSGSRLYRRLAIGGGGEVRTKDCQRIDHPRSFRLPGGATILAAAVKSKKRRFWINEPILCSFKISVKRLIINNLGTRKKVVKKSRLQNEPILETCLKDSNRGRNFIVFAPIDYDYDYDYD